MSVSSASVRPLLAVVACVLVACGQPTLISCPEGELPCGDRCVEVSGDPDHCGSCGAVCTGGASCIAGECMLPGVCAVDNGGCSPEAFCMDVGGTAQCLCMPGFTGTGIVCNPCTMCSSSEFMTAPCTPTTDAVCSACTVCGVGDFASTTCSGMSDAVCSACTQACLDTHFASQACGPTNDLVCTPCTQCAPGQYVDMFCAGSLDTQCAACEANCAQCAGPGPSCFECNVGFTLSEGMCNPAVCGNGLVEGTEVCDDGNMDLGDGCSDQCQVEAGNYCFGNSPSLCRSGGCVADAGTALPLGSDFVLDGAATASAAGITFSQRSTIHTAADVAYPILIEADVIYSGADITFVGARGPGTRDMANGDEPTDTLRARLTQSTGGVELVTGTNDVIASTTAFFTPTPGVPYRVRYIDDGFTAAVEWFNLTNLSEGVALAMPSSFHGTGDRAFVGGGDQGGVTVSNLRVCSAPMLPVTAGLAARYSAIPSWTVVRDGFDLVSQWQDISGNTRHVALDGMNPIFGPGLINFQRPGLDFTGGARLSSAAFALTTDVTVFAVIHHTAAAQWGAIAHHGSRDLDWSMEQSGDTGDPNTLHWQSTNDNVNVDLTLVTDTSYVMAGRLDGTTRSFSATAFTGTSPTPVSFVDVTPSITAGDKQLFVGTSDNNEASNARIADLVYYSRALSDVERDAVIDYLRRLWRP